MARKIILALLIAAIFSSGVMAFITYQDYREKKEAQDMIYIREAADAFEELHRVRYPILYTDDLFTTYSSPGYFEYRNAYIREHGKSPDVPSISDLITRRNAAIEEYNPMCERFMENLETRWKYAPIPEHWTCETY